MEKYKLFCSFLIPNPQPQWWKNHARVKALFPFVFLGFAIFFGGCRKLPQTQGAHKVSERESPSPHTRSCAPSTSKTASPATDLGTWCECAMSYLKPTSKQFGRLKEPKSGSIIWILVASTRPRKKNLVPGHHHPITPTGVENIRTGPAAKDTPPAALLSSP